VSYRSESPPPPTEMRVEAQHEHVTGIRVIPDEDRALSK
jgi:hypothetical protein